jgi:3-dehydroquinate dehydratase II
VTTIWVLHGPSLGALGRREPDRYGHQTLAQLNDELVVVGQRFKLKVECKQSNWEGELVDWLWQAQSAGVKGIVINAAALAHTSLVLADAVAGCGVPVVEVHLTNTAARDEIRHRAIVGAACVGRIEGFGRLSYRLALEALAARLDDEATTA